MRHPFWRVAAVMAVSLMCLFLTRIPAVAGDAKSPDLSFMRTGDEIDMAEVKLGKLAGQHAAIDAVKKFGQRMEQDHSRMNTDLDEIAAKKGITLPNQLDDEHQSLFDQLSKLDGAAFDRAYTKDMLSGHKKAIKEFETEAKAGQDPDIKAWANKWLPTLQEHLQLAEKAVKDVKAGR